jgi:hypothetical protein
LSVSHKPSLRDADIYRTGFHAAGFWGPRLEDPIIGAQRIRQFLQSLASIDPLLTRWSFPVSWTQSGREPVPDSETELRDLIKSRAATLRRGMADGATSGLGANISMWAGDHGNSAGLNIRLGHTSHRISNAVVLNLPTSLNRLLTDQVRCRSVVDAIVSCWDPDRAFIRPADFPRDDVPPLKPGDVVRVEERSHQFPDWIAYTRNLPVVLGGPFASPISTAQP